MTMRSFLTQDQIDRVLAVLAQVEKELPLALAGGLAMQLYGSPRMTRDVDVIVATEPSPEKLTAWGIQPLRRLTFGGRRSKVRGVKTDWIARSDEVAALYEEALANSTKGPIGIPVVRPEDLAAMKLWAGREKDLSDLRYLLVSGVLDESRLKAIVRRHMGAYATKELAALKAEAEWLRGRGEIEFEEDEDEP